MLHISPAGPSRNRAKPAETGSSVPAWDAGSGELLRGGSTDTLTGAPPCHSMRVSRSARGDFERDTKLSGTTRPLPVTEPVAEPSKKKSAKMPTIPAERILLAALYRPPDSCPVNFSSPARMPARKKSKVASYDCAGPVP